MYSEQDLPGLWASDAAWADQDGDGDLDLALIGQAIESGQGVPSAFIFDNESGLYSENQNGSGLVGVYHGAVAWADYDSDGDVDLVISGWDAQDGEVLGLYNNDEIQGGFFADELQLDSDGEKVLVGVRYSSLGWGDVDNDGDLDLVVMGMESGGTSLTTLYVNDSGRFLVDEVNSETLVNLHNGDLAWGDYDGDGDIDLVISGDNVVESSISGLNAVSEFYRNGPVGTLELDSAMGDAVSVKGGSLAWGDYDGDGNIDLAASGRPFGKFDGSDWMASVVLYRNRPAGLLSVDENFTLGTSLAAVGDLSWVDFDNDGDIDLATSGRTVLSSYNASVFLNNDGLLNGVSQESELYGLDGGSTDWVDYNGDGRADLLISGMSDAGERFTDLYVNQGTAPRNSDPTPPATLNEPKVTSSGVIFSWSAGSDGESDILSYNLRVGSESGGEDILSSGVENSAGNVGFKINRSLLKSLAPDQYYWSVQAVDGANAQSAWSQEQILNVGQFVDSDQRLRALKESAMGWGDVDGDGDVDVAISGQNRSGDAQTLFYSNENSFLQVNAQSQLKPVRDGDLSWGDYDNDGDLDLVMTGEDSFGNPQSLLYGFDGGTFVAIGAFESVNSSSVDWGDYDNDGDLDLVISGQSTEIENGLLKSLTQLYSNDGEGSFLAGSELIGLKNGEVSWGDFDSDGDLDLAASGVSASDGRKLAVFGNDEGILTDLGLGLVGVESSDLAWGDYDGDGDLDLASTGISDDGPLTEVYVNDANGGLVSLDANLVGVKGGDIVWGDYDNDRDLDLVVTGNDGTEAVLLVYENTLGRTSSTVPFEIDSSILQFLQGVEFSSVALVDIDGDGDLDLVSSGSTGGFDPQPRTVVNDNLEAQFNSNFSPEVPTTNQAVANGNSVSLSWLTAVDDGEDSPLSLTYDLRVGTSSDGNEVLSGAVAIGLGRIGTVTSHVLNNLSSGLYYWSVRTVDDGFARSDWSDPRSFVIDTVLPTLEDYSLSQSVLGIGQTATLALGFYDEHAGISVSNAPTVELVGDDGRNLFTQLQFTGPAWTGNFMVEENFSSGDYVVEISGIEDNKGNKMLVNVAEAVIQVDADRPALLSSEPFSGEENVVTSINEINLKFSEPMDESTISSETFVWKSGGQVLGNVPEPQYLSETNTVRFFPITSIINPGSDYTVEISATVQDLVGNRPDDASFVSFNTLVPEVLAVIPSVDAVNVASNESSISVEFDGRINTLALDDIQLFKEGEPEALRSDPQYNDEDFTISFEPLDGLQPGTRYEVALPGLLGGPLGAQQTGDFRWTFRTKVPELVSSVPANSAEVGSDTNVLNAVFDVSIDPSDLDSQVSVIKNGQAVSLSDVEFNTANRTLRAVVDEGLRAGTAYTVRIASAVGGPMRQSDYEFRFTTAIPRLKGSTPIGGATDVNAGLEELSLVFSAPVDATQLNTDSFLLTEFGSPVTLRDGDPIDRGDNTYGLAPVDGWTVGTRYELQISPSVEGPLGSGQASSLSFSTKIPVVLSRFPALDDTAVVDMNALIRAKFDGGLDEETLRSDGAVVLLQSGSSVEISEPAFDPVTNELSFNALAGLLPGTAYSVRIDPDVGGALQVNGSAYNWDFASRIPNPVATFPEAGAVTSAGDQRLAVVFSGPLNPALINSQHFRLRRGGSLVALDSDGFSYDAETFTVRYPLIDLRAGSSFSADVQAAVSGPLATNIGLEDLSWSFDTEIPSVLSTSPMDGSDGVSLAAATLNIVFSGPVASQNEKDFQIFSRSVGINEATEQVVKITGFGADTTGTAISFSIDGGLKPFTEYRIIMDRTVLGERAQEGFEWRFTTATSVPDVASGGTIRNASGMFEMYFPPSALEIGNNEVAIKPIMSSREIDQRSDIYSVRTGQEVLNKPATLTIRYNDSDAEGLDKDSQRRFTIKQRAKDGTWKLIGGNVDLAKKSVRTSVEELGEFAIFEDSDADIGSLAIADLDCQPRAFSPNGGSLRDLTDISFDLNNAANITVRVFSSSGSLERVIIKDRQMARGRASIEWDGLDEDRKVVASGLYVVVVSSGNTSSEKIVAVVR
ncbi:MAG: Ig-like domain-containing protein [Candidatus Latescibacterota bacterium]|nr:Ig-like domain-containing protein [Candidatus Latescibacterota bacterium]